MRECLEATTSGVPFHPARRIEIPNSPRPARRGYLHALAPPGPRAQALFGQRWQRAAAAFLAAAGSLAASSVAGPRQRPRCAAEGGPSAGPNRDAVKAEKRTYEGPGRVPGREGPEKETGAQMGGGTEEEGEGREQRTGEDPSPSPGTYSLKPYVLRVLKLSRVRWDRVVGLVAAPGRASAVTSYAHVGV